MEQTIYIELEDYTEMFAQMEAIIDELVKNSTEERNLQYANEDSTPKKRKDYK